MIKKIVKHVSGGLKGEIEVPADKSISHRAVMLASLANGKTVIKNFSRGKDPLSSLNICKVLGVSAEFQDNNLIIKSTGNLIAPKSFLYCGNSGTTMRFMSGILAGQNFDSCLVGDNSLSKRPMKRIIEPLKLMGANIVSNECRAPLKIFGQKLFGINYSSKLSSAQVKSCILLAGLFAEGKTVYSEPYVSRNHTERMLKLMEADINADGTSITISPSKLIPKSIEICGDISSAAYFIVAALVVPDSEIILRNVGLNPTRDGILEVVKKMGGNIQILDKKIVSGEEVGDLKISYSELHACTIEGEIIPKLIDELPVIAVLASQADGVTIVKDASDLRNKESDRISAIVSELWKLGADIDETQDGFIIKGKNKLKGGCEVESYNDHRLAMSLYVAGLVCENQIQINGFEWVSISFPEFEKLFSSIY